MQIIRRNRLGNNTEDITSFSSLIPRGGPVAVIDGYDVLSIQTTPPLEPPIKLPPLPAPLPGGGQAAGAQPALGPIGRPATRLFDVLGLPIKAAPRGITYVASRKMFVFNDDAQTNKLFFTDERGMARGSIDVQFRQAPDFVEGLGSMSAAIPRFGDALAMIAIFNDSNSPSGGQSRLEIIDLEGHVLKEIVPEPDVAQLFLTGVSFNFPPNLRETFLVSSDDDNVIHELDFAGTQVGQFTATARQTGFIGLEGIVSVAPNEIAAANGFAGLLEVFNPIGVPQVVDYRIGLGLSLPNGLAWDSTTNEFLIFGLDRLRPDARFVARLATPLDSFRLAIGTDLFARKVTYLPDEQLIAVGHANNAKDNVPAGILLFNEQGQSAGVIPTGNVNKTAPVILTYLPETREFGVVFRKDDKTHPPSKLRRLQRDGTDTGASIDFGLADIQKISAVTFFKPTSTGAGQFLVFDNTQDMFVVTDFNGAKLNGPFSIRDTLRVLNPTAVTAITTGPDAGAFAISNGENSEVVVFRL
ncbi:MAG TPA: hypothetical protein VE863_19510 [Pyrinomonadaceae bacterium]|jgi:hypothetical protein|nr:hypothetical protein [Pyrinomonadaceae bacterium]